MTHRIWPRTKNKGNIYSCADYHCLAGFRNWW